MEVELFDGQLKRYSSVSAAKVDWLWYPYIPFGKITLLQGDPGCGKSTLIMSIISRTAVLPQMEESSKDRCMSYTSVQRMGLRIQSNRD